MNYTNIDPVSHFLSYALKSSHEACRDLARREQRAKAQCREEGQEYCRPMMLDRAMGRAATYARALGLLNAFIKKRSFHSVERYRYSQASCRTLYANCAKAGRPSLAPAIYGRIYDLSRSQEHAIKLADSLYRHLGWNFGDFMKWVEDAPVDDVAERLLQKSLRRQSAKAAS